MRFLICCGLLAAVAAQAAEMDSPFLEVNNSLSASYLRSHLYYIEPGNAFGSDYLDYEQGDLNGARIALSMMRHWDVDNVYVHLEWGGANSQVAYTGYLLNGTPYDGQSRATTQDYLFKIGKGFAVGSHWMLTPYVSYGKRYWVRELGVGTIGDAIESYSLPYYGLGGMAQFSPLDAIVVTADAFIGRSDSPSINTSNVALYHVGLGQELIKKAGAEFDYRVFKALHAFAGLDYTYFSFGSSPVQATGFFEPFSKTTVYNYTAGLRYSFSGWHPMAGYSAN